METSGNNSYISCFDRAMKVIHGDIMCFCNKFLEISYKYMITPFGIQHKILKTTWILLFHTVTDLLSTQSQISLPLEQDPTLQSDFENISPHG